MNAQVNSATSDSCRANVGAESREFQLTSPEAGTPPASERAWRVAPSAAELADLKRCNYGRFVEAQLVGRTALLHTPIEVFLESSNACNLNCRFCAIRFKTPRPQGPSAIMSSAIMGRVVPWLPGAASCSLHGFGEPLLNRNLMNMAHAVVAHRVDGDFFTNGQLLDESRAYELVTSRFPRLTVSISSADPALYEKLYERGRFSRLVSNLEGLAAEKRRQGTTCPRVTFNAIVTRETLSGLSALVELAGMTGVACVELKPLITHEALVDFQGERVTYLPLRDDPILRAAQEVAQKYGVCFLTEHYVRTGSEKETLIPATGHDWHNPDVVLRAPCPLVFRTIYVRANGETKPCCFASNEPELSLGNILERPIGEVWNGEAYQRIRRAHLTLQTPPNCANCIKLGQAPRTDSTAAWLNCNGIIVPDISSLRSRWERAVGPLWQLLGSAEPDKTSDEMAQFNAYTRTLLGTIKEIDEIETILANIVPEVSGQATGIAQTFHEMRQRADAQARDVSEIGATGRRREGIALADASLARLAQDLRALDTRVRAMWLQQALSLACGEALGDREDSAT